MSNDPTPETALRPFELRLLRYLDQHGPTQRHAIVWDLASPDSKIGWAREHGSNLGGGGSNNGEPMIMANWAKRLIGWGFIEQVNRDGFYVHHRITHTGQAALRQGSLANAA